MNAGAPIVIVGGGPAGLETARAYRDAGGESELVLLSAEDHPPYLRPPLSKEYLRGEQGREELTLESPQFFATRGIDLRTSMTVQSLDAAQRTLTLASEETIAFSACVLATGSAAQRLPVPGGDEDGVLVLRELGDSERLQTQLSPGIRTTVIGSGFIGCEAAASAAMRQARVTLVTDEDALHEQRLGGEVGARIHGWLEDLGVTIVTGSRVERIEESGRAVMLAGGESIHGDVLICATGATPRTELAESAGIELEEGAVPVDSSMRTQTASILAAGDIALAHNEAAGRPLRVEHWGEALAQGEIAGRTLAGQAAAWSQAPGFWSTIGEHTLKQVAWGDGYDDVRVDAGSDGSFTAWYSAGGETVGALCHRRDEDYEKARELLEGRS